MLLPIGKNFELELGASLKREGLYRRVRNLDWHLERQGVKLSIKPLQGTKGALQPPLDQLAFIPWPLWR